MGKASDWLKEERRKTLGDWVSFCLKCGFATRYFDESESEIPKECPQCKGEMRSRCPESVTGRSDRAWSEDSEWLWP